jgi:hypothetical protein
MSIGYYKSYLGFTPSRGQPRASANLLGCYLVSVLLFGLMQATMPGLFLYGPLRRINLMLGMVAILLGLSGCNKGTVKRIVEHPILQAMSLLLIYASFLLFADKVFFAGDRSTLDGLYRYIVYLAIIVAAAFSITSLKDLRRVLSFYMLGCVISAAFGLYCWIMDTSYYIKGPFQFAAIGMRGTRLVGATTDPSTFGMSIAFIIPVCLYYATIAKTKLKSILFLVLVSCLLLAVVFSVSRSSTIVALVGISLFLLRSRLRSANVIFSVVVLLLLSAFIINKMSSESVYSTIGAYQERLTVDSRSAAWTLGYEYFKEVGIIGMGPGSERIRVKTPQIAYAVAGDVNFEGLYTNISTHSFYLTIGIELGLAGLFLFLFVLVYSFRRYRYLGSHFADKLSNELGIINILQIMLIQAMVGMLFLSMLFPITLVVIGVILSPLVTGIYRSSFKQDRVFTSSNRNLPFEKHGSLGR